MPLMNALTKGLFLLHWERLVASLVFAVGLDLGRTLVL